ncbi:DUF4190 domain-containing protein [Pseudonocardia endophytica]|uniref:Uncharacterized protein DUF4190 n=1 Tax=Pseudonocardia endophytica TaxID=401976 RepID=A0A4V2PHP9_PSEEN|nr:DUF4190 domain-containing protein [Pseudonocardia endophytica]TCK21646.1 uncharacterized protein DUF4190 [Pseudonocardia endophytica]
MGTNEPGRTGDDPDAAKDPYGSPYPSGPSYSGYREGVHGEPVPESAWQDPSTQQYPAAPYPQQYPAAPYPQGYQQPPGQYPPYGGQYPAPYPYAPPYRPTNGMAVASLVLGILWIYWIGSILALIFGYLARQQIRERGEGGDGLAVAGIVLGWIGIGVIVLILVVFGIGAANGTIS